jgi:hypothetical protein
LDDDVEGRTSPVGVRGDLLSQLLRRRERREKAFEFLGSR